MWCVYDWWHMIAIEGWRGLDKTLCLLFLLRLGVESPSITFTFTVALVQLGDVHGYPEQDGRNWWLCGRNVEIHLSKVQDSHSTLETWRRITSWSSICQFQETMTKTCKSAHDRWKFRLAHLYGYLLIITKDLQRHLIYMYENGEILIGSVFTLFVSVLTW